MTTHDTGYGYEAGPPTADDLRAVHFTPASMLHPGYTDREVDAFVSRAADELARLADENAQLRDQLQRLEQQVEQASSRPSPSDQAVGILATAQLTADQYVAEAEDFSRQMTSEARTQYEELVTEARERAGAIVQAAAEARAAIAASGGGGNGDSASTQELQEQAAYLRAFGQAVRTQLRSYLEALLVDVETEWGRAHPAVLPADLVAAREQERGGSPALTSRGNTASEEATATAVPATRSPS